MRLELSQWSLTTGFPPECGGGPSPLVSDNVLLREGLNKGRLSVSESERREPVSRSEEASLDSFKGPRVWGWARAYNYPYP